MDREVRVRGVGEVTGGPWGKDRVSSFVESECVNVHVTHDRSTIHHLGAGAAGLYLEDTLILSVWLPEAA